MRVFFYTWTLALLLSLTSYAQELIPESLVQLGQGPYYSNHAFVVDKSNRTLSVWEQTKEKYNKIREFKADFGKMSGNKIAVNDSKTPEGIYFFEKYLDRVRLDFQEYGLHDVRAYPMNYPNLFDRREGKTGYGIWLHTTPDEIPLDRGSRGCVVIRNKDFTDAGTLIKNKNTPIIVDEKTRYTSQKEIEKQRQEIISWLKSWLNSWQTKDMKSYMDYYSKEFRTRGMAYKDWEQYKYGLSQQYDEIKISISDPRVIKFRDQWIIQFLQKYSSNQYEDFGHKTLYLKGDASHLKIIAEYFDNTDSKEAIDQYNALNFDCCSEKNRNISKTN